MRRPFILLAIVVVASAAWLPAQEPLPDTQHALIIGVRSFRQPAPDSPYELTLASGARITVPSADVHEPATRLVRSAMATQSWQPVDPAHLFVLQIQSLAPTGPANATVTLRSGSIVRVRAADVRDPRLTFLQTTLAEAVSLERWERTEYVRKLTADFARMVMDKIRENWQRNQGTAGTVRMKFLVQRDGRITNIEVKESAGEALDMAAMRAVMLTRQIPPLPAEFPEKTLTIEMAFEYIK